MPESKGDAHGVAAYLLVIRLVERLIQLDALSRADWQELVDLALLDAEEAYTDPHRGSVVRACLELLLDRPRDPRP